jgi:hypothetical protein
MMSSQFKEVETAFQTLRRHFRDKEISRREFIDRLKKLRLRDSQGRFWMIGAQSGKWYYFDGRDWVPSDPPAEFSEKVKCFSCGMDNDADAEDCTRCGEPLKEKPSVCPRCGAPLQSPYQKCPACSPEARASSFEEEAISGAAKEDFVLRRLDPSSLFFFSGGTGLILGILIGAFAGASGFLSGIAKGLPDSLALLQGTLMGGIVFAALGGVLGFIVLGGIGALQAFLFNSISGVLGGFRLTFDHPVEKEKEGEEKS